MGTAPLFAFIEVPPFRLSARGESYLNGVNYEVEDFDNENGTTSNVCWLQGSYKGDTFFE